MSDFPLHKKIYKSPQGDIAYFTCMVSPHAQTVLLLHGLSANHTTWLLLMRYLAKRNINSIAPDLRGHGFSDKRKKRKLYKIAVARNDCIGIMTQEGLRKAHIIGYSYGGTIAIDIACTYPTKVLSLLLISANHVQPFKYTPVPILGGIISILLTILGYALVWQRLKRYYYYEQGDATGYWQSTINGLRTMPIAVNLWLLASILRANYQEAVRTITCPTLIVYSKGDAFITKKEIDDLVKKIPNVRLSIIHAHTHFLASHYQDDLVPKITRFLEQQV